ncbi:ATPase [Thermococcus sp.]|uniref:DUF6849 domain-containing protein n=1 Tax=Thermococcus sp. TaxID=35749 RepID=UPI002630C6A0|nr:ATPase [Thermococcus sp.]
MRVLLKPLFDAELPSGFEDILKAKLSGREVRTGVEVEVELLGKPLKFRVLLAEPSPLRIGSGVNLEIVGGALEVLDMEFDDPVEGVLPFGKGFVVMFPRRVLILNQNGQKIYSDEFGELNSVNVSEDVVVVVHDRSKIRIVKP